jgi:hypothetical protein
MGRPLPITFVLVLLTRLASVADARAQGLGGATPQGEAIRAEGQYLRGMAWYEFGAAQAAVINAETQAAWNRAVQADYARYLDERANRLAAKKALRNEHQQDAAKRMAELRRRWLEDPTPDDIRSGLALNALADDLADPKIPPGRWATAPVKLPPEVSIQALAFRFAGAPRFKTLTPRSPGIVAVGRMTGQDWPVSLRRPDLRSERAAYQRAVAALVARCADDRPLRAKDVEDVRGALVALREKAARTVPADGGRLKQANAFLDRLDEATWIFLDHDFADELIRDVEHHRAATVGQLLAFMRKYRLLFAEADDTPESWNTYQILYDLLRRQKTELDAADPAEPTVENTEPGRRAH